METTLIVGITSAAVAAAAIAGSVLTTLITLRHQAELVIGEREDRHKWAAEQRVWEKRADLYWRLITLCVFDRLVWKQEKYLRHLDGLSGELEVWATDDVRAAYKILSDSSPRTAASPEEHERAITNTTDICRTELLGDWQQRGGYGSTTRHAPGRPPPGSPDPGAGAGPSQ